MCFRSSVSVFLAMFGACLAARAEEAKAEPPPPLFSKTGTEAPKAAEGPAPVIVLTSFTVATGNAELSRLSDEIRTVLEQKLGDAGLTIVDRAKIEEALKEAKLALAGLADPANAKQLGKMLGADYLVTGRLSELAGTLIVSGKAIDTETTRVIPVGVEVEGKNKLVAALGQAAQELAAKMRAARNEAKGPEKPAVLLPKVARPKAMAIFVEQHIGQPVPDPASETAVVRFLLQQGFQVVDPAFARQLRMDEKKLKEVRGDPTNIARLGKEHGAQVVILGEAFSERGTEVAGMTACRGRVEAKAIHVETGLLLAYDSEHGGASDIAEHVAGKKAIEAAAEKLMPRFATQVLERWEHPEQAKPAGK